MPETGIIRPFTDDEAAPPKAIAALCDQAEAVWSFFAQVFDSRPLCRDEDARYAVQRELSGLALGPWHSKTALEWCVRTACHTVEEHGDSSDPIRLATSLCTEYGQERSTLLERVDALHAPAVHACHAHGRLTEAAHAAVKHLVDVLHDLWGLNEWDEWGKHRAAVANAIHEARVFADAPPHAVEGEGADVIASRLMPGVAESVAAYFKAHAPPADGAGGATDPERAKGARITDAMLMVRDHPTKSDAWIARAVGVAASTLSRSTYYQRAAAIAREPRAQPPRGRVDCNGAIEAAARAPGDGATRKAPAKAPSVPVVGKPWPGSSRGLLTEQCAGCGEWIGVPAADVGTKPRCKDCGPSDG